MSKISTVWRLVNENGIYWMYLYVIEKLFHKESARLKRVRYEIDNQLPGFNTKFYNRKEWNEYDWSNRGEEWNDSQLWKQSIVNEIIRKHFEAGKTILEIGPGGGKWSVELAPMAKRLILVDLSEKAIDTTKERLAGYNQCEFYHNNGTDLSFIKPGSIDYIWSFDVFVHISPQDTAQYLKEFKRILSPDGIAIIHHPAKGGINGGFRSSVTQSFFNDCLHDNGLVIINQFSRWGTADGYTVEKFGDLVTVFKAASS